MLICNQWAMSSGSNAIEWKQLQETSLPKHVLRLAGKKKTLAENLRITCGGLCHKPSKVILYKLSIKDLLIDSQVKKAQLRDPHKTQTISLLPEGVVSSVRIHLVISYTCSELGRESP